jgi:UDP-2-acetamido-3-amino-2,3-dideoxy-glucuronate N-acetyltransferase
VIGCGYWGRNLVRNFHELGALAGVVDDDMRRSEEHAAQSGVPALGLEEALNRSDIDAVAIATPAATHAAVVLSALAAGKHVFVEKPIALNLEDASTLVERAAAERRVLMVGHLLQYHPAFHQLKGLVDSGRIGRLQYIYSNRLNLGKIRREENVFWSFAPHDISMILALVGELPEQVGAVGVCYLHRTVADVTTTHLAFPSGVNAHVFVSWLHPFKEQKLVVVGDGGMAVFDDGKPWNEKLITYGHRINWIQGMPTPDKAEAEPIALEQAEPLKLECRHFLECVANGSRPRTDGAEGLRVLKVLDAAERSMREARTGVMLGTEPSMPATKRPAPPGVFVHESSFVDEGCTIGPGTKIWHFSHVLQGCRIGSDCTIGQNVMIGPDVNLGDHCKVQNNVSLYKGVTLEEGVFCGPSCVFTNVVNPRAEIERKSEYQPTLVGRGATIGANATIVCGHRIGAYSLIAAGAVVTKDVPAHALVAGVPARRIGWVSHAGERLGPDLICPRTGRRYHETGKNELVEMTEAPVHAPVR